MGEWIMLGASDGFALNAYRAAPSGPARGGVVVIQEVYGVNHWVRSVADRYAEHGYLAVAPAMLDRVEFGYQSDRYGPEQFVVVGEMMKRFDHRLAMVDVAAAVGAAAEGGKVGITGFCFGGRISWVAGHHGLGLAAVSGYYGGGIPNYIGLVPSVPTEMHYGDNDKGIPLEQIEALKARHPAVDIYLYPTGHAFCNSERPSNFNHDACKKASARTLAFFRKHLA